MQNHAVRRAPVAFRGVSAVLAAALTLVLAALAARADIVMPPDPRDTRQPQPPKEQPKEQKGRGCQRSGRIADARPWMWTMPLALLGVLLVLRRQRLAGRA